MTNTKYWWQLISEITPVLNKISNLKLNLHADIFCQTEIWHESLVIVICKCGDTKFVPSGTIKTKSQLVWICFCFVLRKMRIGQNRFDLTSLGFVGAFCCCCVVSRVSWSRHVRVNLREFVNVVSGVHAAPATCWRSCAGAGGAILTVLERQRATYVVPVLLAYGVELSGKFCAQLKKEEQCRNLEYRLARPRIYSLIWRWFDPKLCDKIPVFASIPLRKTPAQLTWQLRVSYMSPFTPPLLCNCEASLHCRTHCSSVDQANLPWWLLRDVWSGLLCWVPTCPPLCPPCRRADMVTGLTCRGTTCYKTEPLSLLHWGSSLEGFCEKIVQCQHIAPRCSKSKRDHNQKKVFNDLKDNWIEQIYRLRLANFTKGSNSNLPFEVIPWTFVVRCFQNHVQGVPAGTEENQLTSVQSSFGLIINPNMTQSHCWGPRFCSCGRTFPFLRGQEARSITTQILYS